MIKITIEVGRDLKFAKEMYNRHWQHPLKQKVLKKDLADFFAMLVEGDLDAEAPNDESDLDDDEDDEV